MGLTFTKVFSHLFAKKEMRSNIFGKERGSWLKIFTYTVFGLGNRQYEHFNKLAKVAYEFLAKGDGKILVPVGLRDDDQCIEDDFTTWKEQLWLKLDLLLRGEDDLSSAFSSCRGKSRL